MSTPKMDTALPTGRFPARIARKLWRAVSRPARRCSHRRPEYIKGVNRFHPQQSTVETEAIPFLQRLVTESHQYDGPIIEIGTLLGVTTTHFALAKSPQQRIITVDLYCWNPWGMKAEVHEALAGQILYYLERTGQVERLRMDKSEFYRTYRGAAPSMVFLDANSQL